jgi:hypothetical protein
MKLTDKEIANIKSSLCYEDKRNPCSDPDVTEYEGDSESKNKACYCDNCFYGRTELALLLIRLTGVKI